MNHRRLYPPPGFMWFTSRRIGDRLSEPAIYTWWKQGRPEDLWNHTDWTWPEYGQPRNEQS